MLVHNTCWVTDGGSGSNNSEPDHDGRPSDNNINDNIGDLTQEEFFQNRINDFRSKMPNSDLRKYGNVATADVNILGIKTKFNAHSRINSSTNKGADVGNFSYLKPENERIFESYVVDGYPRYHDTEAKILEDIASQIKDPNTYGNIKLYTERDVCQSCSNIILEFRRKFPNINLSIFTGQ